MPLPNNWKLEELLQLTISRRFNSATLVKAVEKYRNLEHLLKGSNGFFSSLLQDELFPDKGNRMKDEAEKQLETCEKKDYKIVTPWDDSYPAMLKAIPYAPVALYVWGELQDADSAIVAMVGTRRCTMYGRLTAERFATELSGRGIIISSGLAFGIDTYSHLATIKTGGLTYAVVASGLDRIKPSTMFKNAQKIIDSGGAVISDYACGVTAIPSYFHQRNRIISGLAMATLVVESKEKGGSLITAKFATDQGRDVFAVPGNISSQTSMGTNNLIRNGAFPALSPETMLQDLGMAEPAMAFPGNGSAPKFDNASEEKIYSELSLEPLHIDELSEKTGIDMSELLVNLLNMEFSGAVKQLPGKHYIRSK